MKYLTRSEIAFQLTELGIRKGDALMLHSSLRSLGMVEGGADTVVEAFLDALGEEGTLITPAFTQGAWTGKLAMEDCISECPQDFCPSDSPSHEGVIPNAALRREGRLRSCHPTHSWIANGGDAAFFLKDHQHSLTPCGRGNPFEKLAERDGAIVTLGVDVGRITLWHYYEDILNLPYRGFYHSAERHLSYTATGKRIQYAYPGIMQEVVKASGIMKQSMVGKSLCGIIRARDFKRFMATAIHDNPYCLLLRPPEREEESLAIDALNKAKAMLQAFSAAPREDPGKPQLFEADSADTVREDCPAFAGYYNAGGKTWPLCKANDRHPELFSYGDVFNRWGKTSCEVCPWHHRFPLRRS